MQAGCSEVSCATRSEGARAGCSTEGGLRMQGLVVQRRRSEDARAGCSTEGGLRVQGLVVQ